METELTIEKYNFTIHTDIELGTPTKGFLEGILSDGVKGLDVKFIITNTSFCKFLIDGYLLTPKAPIEGNQKLKIEFEYDGSIPDNFSMGQKWTVMLSFIGPLTA